VLGVSSKRFVILSAAKDLLRFPRGRQQVLRVAQDDNLGK
jgi:hypothetical protein